MNKLIHAGLSRMMKGLTFWLCAVFMLAAGIYVAVISMQGRPLERYFFAYGVIIGIVSSVFCGLFIGTEHGDGTMRNKLIVGHSRTAVYLSNMILCVISGFLLCMAFIVPMLSIGIVRHGFFEMPFPSVLLLFGTTLALSAAWSCIFTLIAMVCRNKAVVAVACILCFILLIYLGAATNSRLQEPPMIDSYVTSIDGIGEMAGEPNPNYISGTKREIYQFLYDINPGGQSLQFAESSMVHTWQLPVYSLIIVLLTTGIGVMIFKKKNIN